jgi:hypothetical protein
VELAGAKVKYTLDEISTHSMCSHFLVFLIQRPPLFVEDRLYMKQLCSPLCYNGLQDSFDSLCFDPIIVQPRRTLFGIGNITCGFCQSVTAIFQDTVEITVAKLINNLSLISYISFTELETAVPSQNKVMMLKNEESRLFNHGLSYLESS